MINVVSFSGGRTSAYLVYKMREWALETGADVRYVFMDTGAEHPKTYDFIRDVVAATGIDLVCLRAKPRPELGKAGYYTRLSVDEIGCDLEPWRDMVRKYGTPYKHGAFCTDRMKLVPYQKWCREQYGDYTTWLGT